MNEAPAVVLAGMLVAACASIHDTLYEHGGSIKPAKGYGVAEIRQRMQSEADQLCEGIRLELNDSLVGELLRGHVDEIHATLHHAQGSWTNGGWAHARLIAYAAGDRARRLQGFLERWGAES